MKVGSGLLMQLERCGLAAQIAGEHAEISDGDFRETRLEITRAFHANDSAQIPEADAALRWLVTEPGEIVSVGEPLDLVDEATGEVIVTGKPGAVVASPEGVLVLVWTSAEWHVESEPEDDLGLLAMGLAAAKGRPFRVATVALGESEVFPRRSATFVTPDQHPALLARIKEAKSRPRIACPGDWCGACKQAVHCHAWTGRAQTALTVFSAEAQVVGTEKPTEMEIPRLDLSNDTAGPLMMRIRAIEKACELAKEQVKSFVRNGGRCIVDGKEYVPGERDGRDSVSVAQLKVLVELHEEDTEEERFLKLEVAKLIKTGEPYEQFSWRKPQPAGAKGARR